MFSPTALIIPANPSRELCCTVIAVNLRLGILMRLLNVVTAALALTTVAFSQDDNGSFYPIDVRFDSFQVRYAANLNKGDSVINITNVGGNIAINGAESTTNNICVNVYAFDPSEEMVSCCSCIVTPNALVSLSVQGDLISNTLSPSTPTSLVIKLVSTDPTQQPCDPGVLEMGGVGMRAWGTTLHALPDGTYGVVESGFQFGGNPADGAINPFERTHLSSFCSFIENNGSGFGLCKSCRAGGLGGAKQ